MKSEAAVQPAAAGRLPNAAERTVRIALALFFIAYGVAKLLGTQFIRSGPTLDLYIAEASGFELTWAYFGYSLLYSHAIALGQIVFAGMLLFDRTVRLGSFGLLTIVANIVLVNFSYHISPSTTVLSLVLLGMVLFLLARDLPAIRQFFWDDATPRLATLRPRTSAALLVLFLVAAFGGFGLVVRAINDAPPALAGDWLVEQVMVDGEPSQSVPGMSDPWEKLYFGGGGHFGVRTDRGIAYGNYAPAPDSTVSIRMGTMSHRRERALPVGTEADPPVLELALRYRTGPDRAGLELSGEHLGRELGIRLRRWEWAKY